MSQAVFTVDDFCYIGDGLYFRILDISEPSNPVSIGKVKCPAIIKEIQVVDTVAYLLDDNGDFRIIDVSDPARPEKIGVYNTGIYFKNFHVVDTLAYLAGGDDGFVIISVSDLVYPVGVIHNTSEVTNCIRVVDTLAYLSGGDGLRIINVSDPINPVKIGSLDNGMDSYIYVCDNLVYGGKGSFGWKIINVSDPTNPLEILDYWSWDNVRYIYGIGDLVYILGTYNLRIFDVSDLANPEQIGTYSEDPNSESLYVGDSLAYVSYGYGGLSIIDISDPTNMVRIGYYDTWNPPLGVQVIDSLAYVADGGDGLRIVDVSDPADPVELGQDTAGSAGDVQVVDSLAYVTAGEDGFRIINISDPNNPFEIACFNTPYSAKGVYVVDSLAYVACYYYEWNNEEKVDMIDGYLCIINVSDPNDPVEIECFRGADAVKDVQVVDNLAYALCLSYRGAQDVLRIIDVSDPTNPFEIGCSEKVPGSSICIVGNLVYTGGGQIINVADPTNPIQVGEFSGGNNILIVDDFLYVVNSTYSVELRRMVGGLRVFNIFYPTNPVETGFYEILGGANDVYVIGDLAYVATAERGLYILNEGGSKLVEGGVPPVSIDSKIKIKYFVANRERVKVEIYNILGQKMEKLIDEVSPPGEYNFRWEGNEGIYFVRIEIGDKVYKKKAIIIR